MFYTQLVQYIVITIIQTILEDETSSYLNLVHAREWIEGIADVAFDIASYVELDNKGEETEDVIYDKCKETVLIHIATKEHN